MHIFRREIWGENIILMDANNKAADQTAQMRSLIGAIFIRFLETINGILAICEIFTF